MLLSVTEFIMRIVGLIMEMCEIVASEISGMTSGLIPPEAVDEVGILVIFILVRAGFEFTKKVLEILIVVFIIYVFIQMLPSVLAMF